MFMDQCVLRQVKVILKDVFHTEEGQMYLSSCGLESKKKCQTEVKRGAKERCSGRGISAENIEQRRASQAHREHINSPFFRGTESASTEKTKTSPLKGIGSPLSKRQRRNTSLKKTEPTSSDEKELCSYNSFDGSVSPHMSIHRQIDSESHTEEYESSPVEEYNTAKSTSSVILQSEENNIPVDEQNNTEQISECTVIETEKDMCSLLQSSPQHKLSSEIHSTQLRSEKIQEENRKNDQEMLASIQRNGELIEEVVRARGSVLRLSLGAVGDQMEKVLPEGEIPAKCSQLQSSDVESQNVTKLHSPEPIVLSSEEDEEEDRNTSQLQTLEGAKDSQIFAFTCERKKNTHISEMQIQASSFMDPVLSRSPVIELQFSSLYISGLSVLSSGLMKITHDTITISLKGTEVKAFIETAHVCKYSVWEGLMVQESGLVQQDETPPPSLLLLWLSESQAQRLSSELSVIQPGSCPAEGSVCLLLSLSESLKGIEGALLASIMDIVGLRHETTELLSPLTHAESIKLLHSNGDTHLLQLLQPRTETSASSQDSISASVPAETAATPINDADVQPKTVYTVCHSQSQGSYNVSMATRPGPEWTPYKHHGPARRLIQFPSPPCKGAITVTTEDLECLDSGEFLNDVIIDFYLKYLLVRKAPNASVRKSHVFSSFFYKQLTRRDNANEDITSTSAQHRRHQRVKTWTRHVDIFEKDFLFVPVNQEAHWYLVVVCFPGMDEPQMIEREGQYVVDGAENSRDSMAGSEIQEGSLHNSDGDKSSDENSSRAISTSGLLNCTEKTCKRKTVCKRPCILILDSLKLSVHERIFKLLRDYLQVEWEVKRGGQRDFSAERMVGSHCRVPLQDNSSDCGLYLLQYAESFLQDPVVHFDLPLRLECWFPRQQVREKREEIRDLVLHLYRFQQDSLGSESSEDRIEMGNVVQ
ncbi:sentrin-specific protease 7 isoform X2 [Hoplias malabaricus]|uniref:sentrin-specific protease 7 isoform X2 n=1 Tax=Hoplias malabaricus TaxID=27720 RepID=UPI003462074F